MNDILITGEVLETFTVVILSIILGLILGFGFGYSNRAK